MCKIPFDSSSGIILGKVQGALAISLRSLLLFPVKSGIILENGGIFSQCALVARELAPLANTIFFYAVLMVPSLFLNTRNHLLLFMLSMAFAYLLFLLDRIGITQDLVPAKRISIWGKGRIL